VANAGILITTEGGAVFLARRSRHVNDPGVWSIPGGRIEPGETAMQAAVREFTEEMGGLIPSVPIRECRQGSYTTFVATADPYFIRHWRPRLNWENDKAGWFYLDQLPSPLHPGVAELLH